MRRRITRRNNWTRNHRKIIDTIKLEDENIVLDVMLNPVAKGFYEIMLRKYHEDKPSRLNFQKILETLKKYAEKNNTNILYFQTWLLTIPIYKEMYKYWKTSNNKKDFKEWISQLSVEEYKKIRDNIVEKIKNKYKINIDFVNKEIEEYKKEKYWLIKKMILREKRVVSKKQDMVEKGNIGKFPTFPKYYITFTQE